MTSSAKLPPPQPSLVNVEPWSCSQCTYSVKTMKFLNIKL